MRIGIATATERRNWPVRRLVRAFEERRCQVSTFCLKDVTVELHSEGTRFLLPGPQPLEVEGIILRSIGAGSTDQITSRISMLECMEFTGIRIFNKAYSHRRAKDKLATLVWLAHHGIPIPRTTVTERMAAALAATRRYGGVVVSKPLRGSRGRGVLRLDDQDLAFRIFKVLQTANQTILVQEFIETPGRDIRVFVVGDRAIGAIYRYAKPGTWKTNVAAGGRPIACPLTPELERLAIRAAQALELDIAGIDVLEVESGLMVSECNSAPNWSGLQKATGVDAAKEIADYVIRQLRS